ncbi:MAG TPA: iron-sulfur cluster assembly scaffold protein [Chloroflexi bacterium]|nr:iron-sulfur cluster assembly scaffold protein [Chloroflexota bacterium]
MDRQSAIDTILDHYENPRNYGRLDNATFVHEGRNPGCGDLVRLYVRLDGEDRIEAIRFEGEGCTISQAAASLLTGLVLGESLDDVLKMDEMLLADALGPEVVMNRLPCVNLSLRILQEGGRAYRQT